MKAQERTLCPLLYEYEYTQTGPRGWVTSARHHFTACARVQAYCNTTCDMCTGETKEKLSLSLSLYIYIYKKIYTNIHSLLPAHSRSAQLHDHMFGVDAGIIFREHMFGLDAGIICSEKDVCVDVGVMFS